MKFTKGQSTMNANFNAIIKELGDQPITINVTVTMGEKSAEFTASDVIQIMRKDFMHFVQLVKGFVKFQRIMRTELVEWVDTAIANAPKVITFMNNPMGEEKEEKEQE